MEKVGLRREGTRREKSPAFNKITDKRNESITLQSESSSYKQGPQTFVPLLYSSVMQPD